MALVTILAALPADGASPAGMLANTTGLVRLTVSLSSVDEQGQWQLCQKNADSGQWSFVNDAKAILTVGPTVNNGALVGEILYSSPDAGANFHVVQVSPQIPEGGTVNGAAGYLTAATAISGPTMGASTVSTLTATGAITAQSTLSVAGALTASAALTVGTTLGVTGASTLTGDIAAGNINLAAGKSLAMLAGAGALSLGLGTGDWTMPTGAGSWTGAANKNLQFTASGTGTITVDNASTWSIGATTGLGGTIGRSGQTLALPGTVNATGVLSPPVVANAAVQGGVPLVFRHTLTSGADGDQDITVTPKIRVIDALIVLKGAGTAGSMVTVKNGATAISDAVDVSAGTDKKIFRITEIDDAQQEIAAGGTLRISKASTGGDFPGAEVYVNALHVA